MNAGEVIQSSFYRGDPALGGGFVPAITPDLSAWQKLADYTFVQKKAEYEEKKKEVETAVGELSKNLAIDWSKMLPQQREEIEKKRNEFVEFIKQNPRAIKHGDPGFFEYQERKNDLSSSVNGAVQRQIEYAAADAFIAENASSDQLKQGWKTELDGRVKGVMDKIDMFPAHYKEPLKLDGPTIDLEVQGLSPDGNFIQTEKGKILDFSRVPQLANDLKNKLATGDLGKIKGGESLMQMKDMATGFNTIVANTLEMQKAGNPQAKDLFVIDAATGKILDLSEKAKVESGDPAIELIKSVKSYNEDVARYNALRGGRAMAYPINWQDGLSDTEVAQMIIFARSNSGVNASDTNANPLTIAQTRADATVRAAYVRGSGIGKQPEEPIIEDFTVLKPNLYQLPDGRWAIPLRLITADMLQRWNWGSDARIAGRNFRKKFDASGSDNDNERYAIVHLKPDGLIDYIEGKGTSVTDEQQKKALRKPGTDNKTTEQPRNGQPATNGRGNVR